MDAAELTDFVSADLVMFTFVAGLLFMAHSNLILTFREVFRREAAREQHSGVDRCQLRLATESGIVAPFQWDVACGGLAPDATLAQLLGFADAGPDSWPRSLLDCSRCVCPHDRGEWFHALRQVRRDKKLEHTFRLVRPNRSIFPATVRAEFEFSPDQHLRRVVGVVIDLTPRGAPDSADRASEVVVRDESVAALQTSAALAHELSQPVGAILGVALSARRSLAEFPDAPTMFAQQLGRLVEASVDASEIISRAKSRYRGEVIPFQELNLNEVVSVAVRKLHGEPCLRHARVVLRLADEDPCVLGDGVELTQVLHNLIRNSANAMTDVALDEREIVVRTSLALGDEARVEVIDRGRGLGGAGPRPRGMGIGLSICRAVALAHGWTMGAINNEDGPGATFTLTLPALELRTRDGELADEIACHRLCRG